MDVFVLRLSIFMYLLCHVCSSGGMDMNTSIVDLMYFRYITELLLSSVFGMEEYLFPNGYTQYIIIILPRHNTY